MNHSMNQKGFTLLELAIVAVIIGVLATVGTLQYTSAIEHARGAEANTIIGQIRSHAIGYYYKHANNLSTYDNTSAGIGTQTDQIPSACRATHFFTYAVSAPTANGLTITATRCTAAGKGPNATTAGTLILATDLSAGTDVWSGTGGY